jgi:integrase
MHQLNKLKQKQIDNAKPREKPYTMADGGGLVLSVQPSGARWWRFRYRFAGRAKMLSMGTYPDTSLAAARQKRDAARQLLASDPPIDPSVDRQARKAAQADSFEAVSNLWFEDKQSINAPVTQERNRYILDRLALIIGKMAVSQIDTTTMLSALRSIQKKHGVETAHRAHGIASRVFAYAIAGGKAQLDPTAGLKASLKSKTTTHRPAITDPAEVGQLLNAIHEFSGQATTAAGLKLLAHNFTRPSEIRLGKWSEIDLENGVWEIPVERMKTRRTNPQPHLLPLSSQSIAILKELHDLTGDGDWVFPTNRPDRPLSENAFNNALKKMGYEGDIHTGHSFRTTASTLLHEMNFSPEVIDTQMAHARGSVSGIYNRSHLLLQRRDMMQQWSDYLDQLRAGGKVIPIRAHG